MLSVINFTAYKCCDRDGYFPSINDKARMCSEPLPWVDMAIGVILCIIGGLAQHIMIPAPIAQILLDVGGAQIGVGALMFMARPCGECCPKIYNKVRVDFAPKIKDFFRSLC